MKKNLIKVIAYLFSVHFLSNIIDLKSYFLQYKTDFDATSYTSQVSSILYTVYSSRFQYVVGSFLIYYLIYSCFPLMSRFKRGCILWLISLLTASSLISGKMVLNFLENKFAFWRISIEVYELFIYFLCAQCIGFLFEKISGNRQGS